MDQRASTLKISKDTARLPLLRQHNWNYFPSTGYWIAHCGAEGSPPCPSSPVKKKKSVLILEGCISQCLWRFPMWRETGETSYQSFILLCLFSAVPLKINFIGWHDKVMPSIFIIRGCVSLSGKAGAVLVGEQHPLDSHNTWNRWRPECLFTALFLYLHLHSVEAFTIIFP